MSDLNGSVLLLCLFAAAILGVVYINRLGQRSRAALLSTLAGRWEGRVHEGGFFRSDRLEIRVDGVVGEITFGDVGGDQRGGWPRLHFNWPSDRLLRVVPEGFSTRLRRLWGGADINFDDPPFDDAFWVESSHPTWARGILGHGARRALSLLRRSRSYGPGQVTLDLGPAGLLLRVSRVLVDDAASLGSFIELAAAVLRKAMSDVAPAGVVFEPLRDRAGSTCPVCGQAVADAPLPCPACRTTHHRDCWKYIGGCAIFGCRTRMR